MEGSCAGSGVGGRIAGGRGQVLVSEGAMAVGIWNRSPVFHFVINAGQDNHGQQESDE